MSTTSAETLPRPPSAATSTIRPFVASDAADVADLLVRAFQNSDRPAPAAMARYLPEVYLDAPWVDPTIASRVMSRPDGRIVGFVGVSALPMALGDRALRTAVISSLAVDPREADPTIGPRLLRDVVAGPHHAVLSDRSNPAAVAMLRALGGEVMRDYSLDWIRSLRPAALAVETLASRLPAARLLAPLARPLDAIALSAGGRGTEPRWTNPGPVPKVTTIREHDISLEEAAALVLRFGASHAMRPTWTDADLAVILGHGGQKRTLGDLVARAVTTRDGNAVGFYLYHLRPGRIAHVLQIMAAPRREGLVIDCAIADAASRGAIAIRGRAQPTLLGALMERRCVFLSELSTIVVSRDEAIMDAFRKGGALFTGIAGENWMRLNGDHF